MVRAIHATVPDQTPESVGLELTPDECERIESRQVIKWDVKGDDGRTVRPSRAASQPISPEDGLPREGRRVEALTEVLACARKPEVNAGQD